MTIGIVCYPTYGGSGVVATELGLELSKRGHEVHFITYNQPVKLNLFNNNIHYHEVIVPDYPLFHYQPYELALSSKIVDMVQLHKIEILHVHYAIPHAYAAYMSKQMLKTRGINLPIVTTLHGTDITLVGSHPYYKNAVEFSINNSDAVTSVSEDLKKDTLSYFNIEKNIEVIPNFVDLDKYNHVHENCNRSVLANEDEKIITHISNFRKVKRIGDVINSFDLINKKDMLASSMSRGDKRRLEMAMCLSQNPKLLLLDEPTAGMARADTQSTIELLKSIQKKLKITMVIIEHDMGVVFSLAQKISVLAQGTVIVEDVPEKIKGHPKVKEAYLGEAQV